MSKEADQLGKASSNVSASTGPFGRTVEHVDSSRPEDEPRTGQLFGRYLITERLGAGGAGVVYAAYDPALDRRVALKLLHTPDTEHGVCEQRTLVPEARAIASLSHPNIVTVHDIGHEGNRTYVAMELVEGGDLATWLQKTPPPEWRAVVRAFIDAGAGLAAAHAKGLLHRDFKPANVLVGHDDWVRVTDFGLATLFQSENSVENLAADTQVDEGDLGPTEDPVGTPYFMPPEQARGDADVRSDIYAFCLALHDGVFGTPAFEATSSLALFALKEQGPKRPSDLRGVPLAVWDVVARGMQPRPEDRWPSMRPLLDALGRALVPPRRTMWPLAAGTAAAAGLIGSLFVSAGPTEPCTHATERLAPVWDDARKDRVLSAVASVDSPLRETVGPRVGQALDRHGTQWVDSHTQICRATLEGEQSEALRDHRMTCLQRQLLEFDATVEILEDADASVLPRADRMVSSLPDSTRCEVLAPNDENTPPAPEDDEARAELARVQAMLNAGLIDDATERSAALVASSDQLHDGRLRADILRVRGSVLKQGSDVEAAVDVLDRAAFAALALGDARGEFEAATILIEMEGHRADRPAAGRRWARFAEAALARTDARDTDRAALASALATVEVQTGNIDAAESKVREALELVGPDSPKTPELLQSLGGIMIRQGKARDALELQERALALREARLGPQHPQVASSLSNVASAHDVLGEFDKADAHFARALEIRTAVFGPEHLDVAVTLANQATSYARRGNAGQAVEGFRRAFQIRSVHLPPTHTRVIAAMNGLAWGLGRQGKHDEAESVLKDVLERLKSSKGGDPNAEANALASLGALRLAQQRPKEAVEFIQRSLSISEQMGGTDNPSLAPTLSNLGNAMVSAGDDEGAIPVLNRALEFRTRQLGAESPQLAPILMTLGAAHRGTGDLDRALDMLERALRLSKKGNLDPIRLALLEFELAQALPNRDRTRAESLARTALGRYRAAVEQDPDIASMQAVQDDLAMIEAFLR